VLNKFLLLACALIVAFGLFAVPFPDGPVALLAVVILSTVAVLIFRKYTEQKDFITTVFLTALALRLLFGILVHVFNWRSFFGGDALAYDANGAVLADMWLGRTRDVTNEIYLYEDPSSGAGWGMNYFTGVIYLLLGRNIFAAQSFCALIGAATAPMVFFCSRKVFNNLNVAKISAMAIAVFPSFVIWSGQLLKDGLVVFLLVTAITMGIELQRRFNYAALVILIFSIFGTLTLRFYIFYMILVAVGGSFVVGLSKTSGSVLRRTLALVLVGVALTYMGVGRKAQIQYQVFGSLQRVQSSRTDLVRSADSGFEGDADVSTAEGALSAVPQGLLYLMFAPFPWQANNLRQAITIPEVLIWWSMIPLLVYGLIYAVRHRLRNAFPILIFSFLLTLFYSIFQGNVGTAYRQRTQIQVFFFMFIAVGWTVYKENKENERLVRVAAQRRVEESLRARLQTTNQV
jgi:hypothetical protein